MTETALAPPIVLPELSFAAYNADPCDEPSIRSGLVKTIIGESMRHAWHAHPKLNPEYKEKHDSKFDLGTVAHELVVGGEERVVICGAVGAVQYDSWRSNASKGARAQTYAAGKTPILKDQLPGVVAMRDALIEHLAERDLAHVFQGGHPEVTLLWKENGVWNRSRPDWLEQLEAPTVVYDYKTTAVSVNPFKLARYAFDMGWDIQAAMIARGVKACLGTTGDVEVRFVAQENKPPYIATVVACSKYSVELADVEITVAQRRWGLALKTTNWDAYPKEIAYIDTPEYLVAQREQRREIECL